MLLFGAETRIDKLSGFDELVHREMDQYEKCTKRACKRGFRLDKNKKARFIRRIDGPGDTRPCPMDNGVLMKPERIRSHPKGPKVRPMCPETEAEVIAGFIRSLQITGYDWTVREIRRVKGSDNVTLPPQVKKYLQLIRGDWIAFGSTTWGCLFGLMRVSQERAEEILKSKDKGRAVPIRKVKWKKRQATVAVPATICRKLEVEDGDCAVFVPPVQPDIVGMGILRSPGDQAGSRREG